jgi:hypothetical protein
MASDTLSKSFRSHVHIRPDRDHSKLKQHFEPGSLLYELVGYLDKQAARNRFRLVFAKYQKIKSECKKGKWETGTQDGDENHTRPEVSFSRRQYFYGIKWLREHHIISEQFTIKPDSLLFPPAFHGRKGFIVADHDRLCQRHDDTCVLFDSKAREYPESFRLPPLPPAGPSRRPPGDARKRTLLKHCSSIAHADSEHSPSNPLGEDKESPRIEGPKSICNQQKSCELSRSCPGVIPESSRNESVAPSIAPKLESIAPAIAPKIESVAPSVAPAIALNSSDHCTTHCTDHCTTSPNQVAPNQPLTSSTNENGISVGNEFANAEPLEPLDPFIHPAEPLEKQPVKPVLCKTANKQTSSLGALPQTPMNERSENQNPDHDKSKTKTIGEYFPDWSWEDIDELTDGELETENRTFKTYEYSDELEAIITAIIAERKNDKFLGRTTLAAIMNLAMRRLRQEHNADAPASWLPVIRELKNSPRKIESVVESTRKHFFQANGRPVFTSQSSPSIPESINDPWETCVDGISRRKADRERLGYTVQGVDKVWERPA